MGSASGMPVPRNRASNRSCQRFGGRSPGTGRVMDQGRAPVLDAIGRFHSDGMATYALPGHRLGRGIDADTAAVLTPGTFAGDVLMAKQAVPDAEAISPYPPGVPAVLPGERLNRAVVDYLGAGE